MAPCFGISDFWENLPLILLSVNNSQLNFSYFAWRSPDLENGVGDEKKKGHSPVPVNMGAASGCS